MIGSLDQFLSPGAPKPKDPEERCANPQCRKILGSNTIKYKLTTKGKTMTYCQKCAKAVLRPLEAAESI